jgi:hypothetical protein
VFPDGSGYETDLEYVQSGFHHFQPITYNTIIPQELQGIFGCNSIRSGITTEYNNA